MNKKECQVNTYNQKFTYETLKKHLLYIASIKTKYNDVYKKNNLINPKIILRTKNKNKKNIDVSLKAKCNNNSRLSFLNIEKKIYKRFFNCYCTNEDFYNIKIINEIISNENTHIVAEFKDFLIKDDYSEFVQNYYNKKDIKILLKQILEYYKLSSIVYPNYILLPQNKYIYRNIQKKQKILDDQQDQEEKNNYIGKKLKNWTMRIKPLNKSELVFDSTILDSILNQSNTSQIKKGVFGISKENSINIDDNKFFDIINNINKAEKNYNNKNIEKNKLINNKNNNKKNDKNSSKNKKSNDNNNNKNYQKNKLKQEQNILKNNKQSNKIKQCINYNKDRNNKKLSIQNLTELSDCGKTHIHLSSNLKNTKNMNNKGNIVSSLNSYKDKENKDLKINKTPLQDKNYIITDKIINSNNRHSVDNNEYTYKNKDKYYGRNYRINILGPIGTNELKELHKIFKSDLNININHNNIIINENNNIYFKKSGNHRKGKKNNINKNKNILSELSKKKLNDKSNKFIKKTIISELLSLCSSNKDTLQTTKLTESQRELSHSVKKNERVKKSKNINRKTISKNKKNTSHLLLDNNNIFLNNTSRDYFFNKKNKGISLDIESINNNNNINNGERRKIIKNTTKNNYKKNSYNDLNTNNNKDTFIMNRDEGSSQYSKQYMNSSIKKDSKYNLINFKDKSKYTKRGILNGKKFSNNRLINRKSNYYKNSRNKSNLFNNNNILTYAIFNMKKYLNTNNSMNSNSNTNNNNYRKHSNNNIICPHQTKSSTSTTLKDRLKLNFDCIKQKDNIYKRKESTRKNLITTKNSTHSCIGKNSMNITEKKKKQFYPLSARESNIKNNNFIKKKYYNSNRNFIGVLTKNNKCKNKTFKNSLNETCINNLLFNYTNSNKNKNQYIKIMQPRNNQKLIFSNVINKKYDKKYDTKKMVNCTMSEIRSLRQNKKLTNIHNHAISTNNTELYSFLLNNFNSSLNNLSTRNNNNESISLNELKKMINNDDNNTNNNSNYIYTPNLRKKKGNTIYNSNKNRKNIFASNKSISNQKLNNYLNELHYNVNKKKIKNNKNIKHKQHIKLNTTEFSTGNLNINSNNLTNNYSVNYNNSIITTTNPNKEKNIQFQNNNYNNYNYKKIKKIKNNLKGFKINKIDKLFLKSNKNNDFFPLALTDRSFKINLFSPINNYSLNAPIKNKK